ncbi:MAG: response regulator [Oscillospiraceae bacterium]
MLENLQYNIYFELSAVIYMIVLNVYIRLQFNSKSMVNKLFKTVAVLLLFANIFDIITAITISYALYIPTWINMILNYIYLAMDLAMEFLFMMYSLACVNKGDIRKTVIYRISLVLAILSFLMLTLNFATKWLFDFSPTEGYVHGPLYMVLYVVPFVFIFIVTGILLSNFKNFNTNQRVTIICYAITTIIGPLVQMFFPDILFVLFTVSVGYMMLMFSLETPDYEALQRTNAELIQTRDEAEEATAAAQKANQAKTEFLSGMSHEVRTPINAILGYNEMILRECSDKDIIQYSMNVQSAGKTLLSIVSDILDYTEIENGRLELDNADYSAVSVLNDVITYGEYYTEKKDIKLKTNISSDIPTMLHGDSIRITQIFNNLVSNAVKYTDTGYVEIGVSWEQTGTDKGCLSAYIKDTGIGMKEEDVSRISSSFLRMDKKRTQNIQGIGLGLTIVTRLLAKMDSKLIVKSEYEKGTTVSFRIEQTVVDPKPVGVFRTSGSSVQYNSGKVPLFTAPNAKILAVDDNSMNLDLFKGNLKHTKIIIDTATNGVEALALINKNKYDLIFLDHMMPVMDGMETLKTIKKQNLCPNVPIIVITANALPGEKEVYLNAGFDEYLSKPVTSKQLCETVRRFLPAGFIYDADSEESYESCNIPSSPAVQSIIEAPPAAPESAADSGSLLERLSFLDTETGMMYCCDSEEFYLEIINTYLSERKTDSIKQYFDSEDYDNYRIQVHALKSTSRTIGAADMASEAEKLEMAAKSGDTEYIKANTQRVLTEYAALLEKLENAVNPAAKPVPAEPTVEPVQAETPASSADTDSDDDTQDEVITRINIQNARVLVADDDIMYRCIAEYMLKEKFIVDTVSSGAELLKHIEKQHTDIILLDLHMQDMDGIRMLQILKSTPQYEDIPVILLTADDDKNVELKCLQSGAVDYITKPFVKDILIQRMMRILDLDMLQKHLQSEVRKQTRKAREGRQAFERLSVQTMRTLAQTVDAKDKFTSNHSIRVAEYSREIARRSGMNQVQQDEIYFEGLLHDIGLIGVPDSIINKMDTLTEAEFEVMRKHSLEGGKILSTISEIPTIADGAKWHHERYDGMGYPDGLKGDEIPEAARIICIADAYDAMTSNRSYRPVCSREYVYSEMQKGRGTQFDPKYLDIMLTMIDEDKEYRMRGTL